MSSRDDTRDGSERLASLAFCFTKDALHKPRLSSDGVSVVRTLSSFVKKNVSSVKILTYTFIKNVSRLDRPELTGKSSGDCNAEN